jgi:hypothetical protein
MDIGAYNFSGFPKLVYHPTELPKTVQNPVEEEALVAEGWSTTYIVQAYPKCMFSTDGQVKNVANPEEEAALGPGWSDTPPVTPDVPPVTLNPTSASLPATAGTGTFTVTITGTGLSNTWTVVPDAAATWLSITAPTAPQSVNGPVSYSVTENTNSARTAGIYVNGKTFSIDQAGTVAARSRKS